MHVSGVAMFGRFQIMLNWTANGRTGHPGQTGHPYRGGVLSVRSGMPCGQSSLVRDMSDLSLKSRNGSNGISRTLTRAKECVSIFGSNHAKVLTSPLAHTNPFWRATLAPFTEPTFWRKLKRAETGLDHVFMGGNAFAIELRVFTQLKVNTLLITLVRKMRLALLNLSLGYLGQRPGYGVNQINSHLGSPLEAPKQSSDKYISFPEAVWNGFRRALSSIDILPSGWGTVGTADLKVRIRDIHGCSARMPNYQLKLPKIRVLSEKYDPFFRQNCFGVC